MDPDSRAEYDAISGFAIAGINPFMDATYAAEYAFVDEFSCIGCRNCNNVCPKTFEMEEEHGRARVMRQDADTPEKVQEAIDTCPVSCIHWVTAPQLTMLEETMGKMERVDTWVLMNGGGKGANLNVSVCIVLLSHTSPQLMASLIVSELLILCAMEKLFRG